MDDSNKYIDRRIPGTISYDIMSYYRYLGLGQRTKNVIGTCVGVKMLYLLLTIFFLNGNLKCRFESSRYNVTPQSFSDIV